MPLDNETVSLTDSYDGIYLEIAEIVDESGHYITDWEYVNANHSLFEKIGRTKCNHTFVTTFRYLGGEVT